MKHFRITDPFRPSVGVQKDIPDVYSVRECLASVYPNFTDFRLPTIIYVNGKPKLRAEWDDRLRGDEIITEQPIPGDVTTLVIVVVVAAIAGVVVAALLLPTMPKLPGQIREPDSVYNLSGQRNQNRLTYPIEVPYGRFRLWPSYAASPYNQYIGNEQYLFQLLCLGQGEYEIEKVQIEDTDINDFQEVSYEISRPGEPVLLFPNRVVTSVEVANIELKASNEPGYPAPDGWFGPFVASPELTETAVLEFDFVFPNGLYYQNDDGGLRSLTVTAEVEVQLIPEGGGAPPPWERVLTFTKTLKTNTPQRVTERVTLPVAGRVRVRARRTGTKNTDIRAQSTLVWESVRAFLTSSQDYGDVTLIAVKAKATNSLNNSSSNRINVIATRKLPIYDQATGKWSEPVATRSIIWAFCDVFRADYGARLDSKFLDMPTLLTLESLLKNRGDFFDWVFDSKTSVWEAAVAVARAGRCVPTLTGSTITLVRDEPKTVPTAMFTPDNIVRDSFQWQLKLTDIDEFDGLEVEYTDDTTWKPETLICVLPGELGENVESLKLAGVTSRAQAWREGLYMRAIRRKVRENVVFKTGLEGILPAMGDLIAVSHDTPRWGAAGVILEVGADFVLLDRPVVFTPGFNHQLLIRRRDGKADGPFIVTAHPDGTPEKLSISGLILANLNLTDSGEPPYFMFGQEERACKLCKVASVTPSDGEEVEIVSAVYVPEVYGFDSVPVPPLLTSGRPRPIPTPAIAAIYVSNQSSAVITVTWTPVIDATAYIIEQSLDSVNWTPVASVLSPGVNIAVQFGTLYLRVAAIINSRGPWLEWEGVVGFATAPGAVTTFSRTSATNSQQTWTWTPSIGSVATRIIMTSYNGSSEVIVRDIEVTGSPFFSYTPQLGRLDGAIGGRFRFVLEAVGASGAHSDPATFFSAEPDLMAPSFFRAMTADDSALVPGNPAKRQLVLNITPLSGDLSGAAATYWYLGTTSDFVPSPANLLGKSTTASPYSFVGTVDAVHPILYLRAVICDEWGALAPEQTFPNSTSGRYGSATLPART